MTHIGTENRFLVNRGKEGVWKVKWVKKTTVW